MWPDSRKEFLVDWMWVVRKRRIKNDSETGEHYAK